MLNLLHYNAQKKIKVWRDDKRVVRESLQVPTVLPKPPASESRYVDTISRYLNYISFWASCKHFIEDGGEGNVDTVYQSVDKKSLPNAKCG